MTSPHVSVCVSTLNRAHLLPRLVAHLEAQTMPLDEFEVVIADDGSEDDTAAVLAQLASVSPLNLRFVTSAVRTGAAAGRNRAWRAARGEVIAFTDDDCAPTPDWLAAGWAAMRGRRAIAAGRVTWLLDDNTPYGPFSRYVLVEEPWAEWYATANVFVHRALLDEVGGFDERWRIAGEDTDMAWRVISAGAERLWLPEALVRHDVGPNDLAGMIREQRRWIDMPGIMKLHPQACRTLLRHRWISKRSHELLLLLFAGVALSSRNRVALVLALPWLRHTTATIARGRTREERWGAVPGMFAVDVAEMATLVRGSIKHRSLMI